MEILGIFGHPVAHSLSPRMHRAALKATGFGNKFVYLSFDISPHSLEDAVRAIRVLNIRGVNITIPFKEKIIPYLDQVDAQARIMGAVNTVLNEDGCLKGFNTDGSGFLRAMKEETGKDLKGKRILILGAGGACRALAAVFSLQRSQEIVIANRSRDRAIAVAEMINKLGTRATVIGLESQVLRKEAEKADLVINTTPLGMAGNFESPMGTAASGLHPGQVVCDIVYNPVETVLLKQAKNRGCQIVSGLGMLLFQGAEAFQIWTGVEAPVDVMRQELKQSQENTDLI